MLHSLIRTFGCNPHQIMVDCCFIQSRKLCQLDRSIILQRGVYFNLISADYKVLSIIILGDPPWGSSLGILHGDPPWGSSLGILLGNAQWEPPAGTYNGIPYWEFLSGILFGNLSGNSQLEPSLRIFIGKSSCSSLLYL